MNRFSVALGCSVTTLLAACGTIEGPSETLPRGVAAYQTIPVANTASDYRIGALDAIDVVVFQEPDLSVKAAQVDASGSVSLPLVGKVAAAGKTVGELSSQIAQRLGEKYLVNPQVSVLVASSVSQKVIVQGAVAQPGVYDVKGRTTLLEALAMAKGETKIASMKEVAVFRTVNGQRMGAVFDVASIRRGLSQDPEILGNDVVVVAESKNRAIWQNVLGAVPILNMFRPLGY